MLRTFIITGVTFFVVAPAFADNTATDNVSVTGLIRNPIEITKTQDMIMPDIVSANDNDGGTTQVTLSCAGDGTKTVAWTAGSNPFAGGDTNATTIGASNSAGTVGQPNREGQCATLTLTGENGFYYGISVSAVNFTSDPGNSDLFPLCVGDNGNQLAATGGTVYCGATFETRTNSNTQAYAANFDVTVTYD